MVPALDSSANRPSIRTVLVALAAGVANAGIVLALYARDAYPALESTGSTAGLVATMVVVGVVPVFVSAYTRLFTPTLGLLAVLAGTTYLDVTSPSPEWGELGGYAIVEGPTYVASYANAWHLWLALALYAGVLEFGIRRRYGVADGRLQNLPSLPRARSTIAGWTAGGAGLIALATTLLVLEAGIRPPVAAGAVFAVAFAVAAVPVGGLFTRGLLAPLVLFALAVPYVLVFEVFVTTDSPVHILLFGPYALVLAIVGALEATIRARFGGGNTGSARSDTTI
ncbi:hypothetical protein D8Y22_03755 [Salinadaptatus halalkaliphilus]|uniref:Uncharacterized protein n=1 Tax=Salinadaptatus halalkaliphilus TaxID=2419781 RepID=A0A4S3TNZ9_9EURY|nr:hypothetical protein [Salinadaptatus halalkaliphilus]THE66049.1 hypothetical protein D8Y22_03755 [Salinadaptatus halalkaliphilus]